MFDDSKLKEPEYIIEIENPLKVCNFENGKDGIFFNDKYTKETRIREYVYNLIIKAKKHLPKNYNFIVYEGYRTLESQQTGE